jgi:hypothetical protein
VVTTTRVVIHLVHGTWAPNAAWTRRGSRIRQAIERRFGAVEVRPFRWGGRNSHASRMRAARALARRLTGAIERAPRSHHFVIAHSHGGNVALHGLACLSDPNRVLGLITLSTPFLEAQARTCTQEVEAFESFSRVLQSTGACLLAILPFMAGGALLETFAPRLFGWLDSEHFAAKVVTWFLGVMMLGTAIGVVQTTWEKGTPAWAQSWLHSLEARGDRILLESKLPTVAVPHLAISFDQDEALLGLSTAVHAGRVPFWAARLTAWYRRALGGLGLLSVVIWRFVAPAFHEKGAVSILFIGIAFGVLWFVPTAVTWVTLVAVPTAFRTSAFGPGSLFENLLVEFRVHRDLPSEQSTILHRTLAESLKSAGVRRSVQSISLGWLHGLPYQDPVCVETIVDWIEARCSSSPQLGT